MNLWAKKDYVIELRHLQECVKLGFVVTSIHKALSYDQTQWLAPFIEKVVKLRQKASSVEEDKLLKLVMNSLAGRLQMNVRKHDNTMAVLNVCVDDFSSPRFRGLHTVYGDPNDRSTTALHLLTTRKSSIELNAPIFVGVNVLELAKCHNLKLWYGGIRSCWADARLLVHDTDSFYIAVKGDDDVVEKLKAIDCVDGQKTKRPGLLKIEAERITEIIALGKKMYSCVLNDGDRKCATVGLKVSPTHETFRERLRGGDSMAIPIETTRWEGSERKVMTEERQFAAVVDCSRYWNADGTSRALGHFV
jgi:hypothetical protein